MEESGFMKKANCYDSPGGANKVLELKKYFHRLFMSRSCVASW